MKKLIVVLITLLIGIITIHVYASSMKHDAISLAKKESPTQYELTYKSIVLLEYSNLTLYIPIHLDPLFQSNVPPRSSDLDPPSL
jgi:hypothetical protein